MYVYILYILHYIVMKITIIRSSKYLTRLINLSTNFMEKNLANLIYNRYWVALPFNTQY